MAIVLFFTPPNFWVRHPIHRLCLTSNIEFMYTFWHLGIAHCISKCARIRYQCAEQTFNLLILLFTCYQLFLNCSPFSLLHSIVGSSHWHNSIRQLFFTSGCIFMPACIFIIMITIHLTLFIHMSTFHGIVNCLINWCSKFSTYLKIYNFVYTWYMIAHMHAFLYICTFALFFVIIIPTIPMYMDQCLIQYLEVYLHSVSTVYCLYYLQFLSIAPKICSSYYIQFLPICTRVLLNYLTQISQYHLLPLFSYYNAMLYILLQHTYVHVLRMFYILYYTLQHCTHMLAYLRWQQLLGCTTLKVLHVDCSCIDCPRINCPTCQLSMYHTQPFFLPRLATYHFLVVIRFS